MRRTCPERPATRGADPNDRNLLTEPGDHGIGRSRGGLTSKIHYLVDGRGLPLVVLVGAGQAHDNPMLPALLAHLRVARDGPGRPRTTPDRLRADKAYSASSTRELLAARGVKATIPQPSDQIAHRKRRGSAGGRPPMFDPVDYKHRHVVEGSFAIVKQWRGLATRYELAIVYRAGALLNAIYQWLKALRNTP